MFRNELKTRLLENKMIIEAIKTGELNDDKLSVLIDQARDQALPLLQRYTFGTLFISTGKASKEDMIEILEKYVISDLNKINFDSKQYR